MNDFNLRRSLFGLMFLWIGLFLHGDFQQTAQEGATIYLPIVSHAQVMEIPILDMVSGYGGLGVVIGTIHNTSPWPVYDVVVELTAWDSNNQIMGTYHVTPTLAASLPGEMNPFGKVFPEGSPDQYTAEVVAYSFENAAAYRSVTVLNVELEDQGNYQYIVKVEIRNDTPHVLTDVTGYIWLRGEVMMGPPALMAITTSLMPGETAQFSRWSYYIDWLPPSVYSVYTQAQGIVSPSPP